MAALSDCGSRPKSSKPAELIPGCASSMRRLEVSQTEFDRKFLPAHRTQNLLSHEKGSKMARILICDDDLTFQLASRQTLSRGGSHECLWAKNTEEARVLLRKGGFALIMLDLE
jgi:hypothetical protein